MPGSTTMLISKANKVYNMFRNNTDRLLLTNYDKNVFARSDLNDLKLTEELVRQIFFCNFIEYVVIQFLKLAHLPTLPSENNVYIV